MHGGKGCRRGRSRRTLLVLGRPLRLDIFQRGRSAVSWWKEEELGEKMFLLVIACVTEVVCAGELRKKMRSDGDILE